MHFKLLGPLEVEAEDGLLPLGGRKQRTVLADLLLYREDGIGVDRLVFDVWGDEAPPTATRTLKAYISRLRRDLGEGAIVRTAGGYRLVTDTDEVDADQFERFVARADTLAPNDPDSAVESYRSALRLWRGDVLGELGEEGFARPEAARLHELRDLAREALFDIELDSGRHRDLIPTLTAAAIANPHREHIWLQLMVALYRSGRQAEALRAYQRAARALGEELGIEPGPELRDLEEQILLHDPGLRHQAREFERHATPANPTNLREVAASFVGRQAELDELGVLLSHARLVTITGTGGVGKTRLALEAGWTLLERYPGGVWDVDLAQLVGEGDALGALANALGISERSGGPILDRVTARIGGKATLVVFDNCEHMVGPVAEAVEQLVAECANLSVLATSRIPLAIAKEQIFFLQPLSLPPAASNDLGTLATADSVQLFLDRGVTAHSGLRLTATNSAAVANIVHLLDGIPLALELAAARLALLTPSQIALELQEGFPALSTKASQGGDQKQETLRAAIDWSYELLPVDERTLLDRIGVFAAGFSLEEAAEVCSSEEIVAEDIPLLIASLATKSMVSGPFRSAPDGRSRYRALELVRRYGVDRLSAAGVLGYWQLRHATAMEAAAGEAAGHFHDPDQKGWYDRLRSSQSELDRALHYAVDLGEVGLGRRLCGHLWLWWYLEGKLNCGVDWIDRYTDGGVDPEDPLTAYLLAATAELLSERGSAAEHTSVSDEERLLGCVNDAVAAAIDVQDSRLAAEIRLLCGDALAGVGRYDDAEPLLEQAAKAFSEAAIPWAEGWALLRLVRVHTLGRADFATADALMERAEELLETAGDIRHSAYAQLMYANRARLLSDYPESLDHIQGALRTFRDLGFDGLIDEALLYLASDFVELGRIAEAVDAIAEMRHRARATEEPSWLTVADIFEALVMQRRGDDESSVALLDDTIGRCREQGDSFNAGVAATALVWALLGVGDSRRAATVAGDAVRAWETIAHPWHGAASIVAAAEVALARQDADEAADRFTAGVAAYASLSHRQGLACALEGLSAVAQRRGRPSDAARLLGAAGQLRDECGAPPLRRILERNQEIARWSSSELGEPAFVAAWERGVDPAGDLATLTAALNVRPTATRV